MSRKNTQQKNMTDDKIISIDFHRDSALYEVLITNATIQQVELNDYVVKLLKLSISSEKKNEQSSRSTKNSNFPIPQRKLTELVVLLLIFVAGVLFAVYALSR